MATCRHGVDLRLCCHDVIGGQLYVHTYPGDNVVTTAAWARHWAWAEGMLVRLFTQSMS